MLPSKINTVKVRKYICQIEFSNYISDLFLRVAKRKFWSDEASVKYPSKVVVIIERANNSTTSL